MDAPNSSGVQMFKRAALLSSLTLLGVLLGAAPALAGVGLSPSPSQLEFGEVDLHYGGSPRQSVNFSDAAPLGSITIESASVEGPQASSFRIVGDGCSGLRLEFAQSCSIEIAFEGASRGAHSATLALVTDEGPVEVPLSGEDVTGTLSASPDPLTFTPIPYTAPGTHNEGEDNETEQVTVQNSANASTRVESASIVGPDASSFSIQWNCDGDVLGDSNSCTVGVRFQPTSLGPQSASLVIESDSAGSPLVVPLSGVGLHGPTLTLSTQQALLGDVALGSSAQQTLTVSDTGDYPLYIQRTFLVSGTPLMFPVLSDECSGHVLEPNESCAIVLAFRPTTLGEKDASLLFITNAPAIGVAGIDGVGVRGESEAAPALAPVFPAASDSTSPAYPTPPPTPAPAAAAERAIVAPATLTALRAPRLYTLLGRATVDPGSDVQCPPAARTCEALALILPADPSRSAAAGFGHAPATLGSAVVQLRGGQGAHVRIPLSRAAVALLRRRGRLDVRALVVVQSGGAVIAEHSWTLQLSARGGVSRLP